MSEYAVRQAIRVHQRLYDLLQRLKGMVDSPNWLKKEIEELSHEADCVAGELKRIDTGEVEDECHSKYCHYLHYADQPCDCGGSTKTRPKTVRDMLEGK